MKNSHTAVGSGFRIVARKPHIGRMFRTQLVYRYIELIKIYPILNNSPRFCNGLYSMYTIAIHFINNCIFSLSPFFQLYKSYIGKICITETCYFQCARHVKSYQFLPCFQPERYVPDLNSCFRCFDTCFHRLHDHYFIRILGRSSAFHELPRSSTDTLLSVVLILVSVVFVLPFFSMGQIETEGRNYPPSAWCVYIYIYILTSGQTTVKSGINSRS